jgi:carbonic anhydrase
VTYPDASVCEAPSVTLPNDPNLVTLGLGLNPGVQLGSAVYGKEAGKTYKAAQFHIHSKSEHTINGQVFEAELHIVHLQESMTGVTLIDDLLVGTGIDGSRGASVVGFMIKSNASVPNAMFENLLYGFETAGCGVLSGNVNGASSAAFNPYNFLAPDTCIYNYDGSLTTPTCDEIVEWNLASKPISVTFSQMNRLLALINGCPQSISFNGSTSRPTQPLNGRKINKICADRRRNLRTPAN